MRTLGKVSQSPEAFGVDILFTAQGRLIGIQRKEFSDCLASIRDGRLAKESSQMQRLGTAILLLEGRGRWSADGQLLHAYHSGWTYEQFSNFLLSIQSRGIWLLTTDDLTATVALIPKIRSWFEKDTHAALFRRPKPTNTWGERGNTEQALWILQSIDGIGHDTAKRIYDHFGRIPFTLDVTDDELLAIDGVGPKTVAKIRKVFG